MLKPDTLLDNDQDVAPPVYPARILTNDAEAIAAAHEVARFVEVLGYIAANGRRLVSDRLDCRYSISRVFGYQ